MLCWSLRVELAAWAGCGHQARANRQATREAGHAMVTSAPRMCAAGELHETNRYLPAVRRLGVPVLVADIRLPETLEVLHVGRARSVVVVTSSDIVNLETA